MDEPEVVFPHKKFSIYNARTGHIKPLKENYTSSQRTICGENILLAHVIRDEVEDPILKDKLLRHVDVIYDMGRRMGNKLVKYAVKEGNSKWREGF